MLTETVVASFLLGCLACFFTINLHNITVVHKRRDKVKVYAEVERPSGNVLRMAAVGTLLYFLEVASYIFLAFTGTISTLHYFPFYFQHQLTPFIEMPGLVTTAIGYFLFIWSVVARGKYATSWQMPENQRLVTWGPYRYVRHPSYLGYFTMFFGLFSLWPNLFTLFPLCAIPGYFRVASEEEKLLTKRFKDEYLQYQHRTGRFIPRV